LPKGKQGNANEKQREIDQKMAVGDSGNTPWFTHPTLHANIIALRLDFMFIQLHTAEAMQQEGTECGIKSMSPFISLWFAYYL